jgi:hypothetical protein
MRSISMMITLYEIKGRDWHVTRYFRMALLFAFNGCEAIGALTTSIVFPPL